MCGLICVRFAQARRTEPVGPTEIDAQCAWITAPETLRGVEKLMPLSVERLNRTFVALSASYGESVTDTSGDEPERLDGARVTPRFFAVDGTPPIVGRAFTDAEPIMPTW